MIYNAKEVNSKLKVLYEKSHRNGGAVRHITSTYGLLGTLLDQDHLALMNC